MNLVLRSFLIVSSFWVFITLIIAGCSGDSQKKSATPTHTVKGRWFTPQQFELGKKVYAENCARCHGPYGQGIVDDWKKPNPDGSFPPPPLNGTAHTWHHPFSVLMKTIDEGGAPVGGNMPAFREILSEEEKIAVIAYFQSWWDDKTYNRWVKMNADE